jgi:hypothetical protein
MCKSIFYANEKRLLLPNALIGTSHDRGQFAVFYRNAMYLILVPNCARARSIGKSCHTGIVFIVVFKSRNSSRNEELES